MNVVIPLVQVLRPGGILLPCMIALRTESHSGGLLDMEIAGPSSYCPQFFYLTSLRFLFLNLGHVFILRMQLDPRRRPIQGSSGLFMGLVYIRIPKLRLVDSQLLICLSHRSLSRTES